MGKQETVPLADGSSIVLNTDSAVRTNYSRRERVVYLQRGEALFDVEPDPTRPFMVHAGGKTFRAVGTVFALRLNDSGVKLTVSEGLVEISGVGPAGAPQRVAALHDAQIVGAEAEVHALDEEALSRSLAWRRGFLAFKGETLGYVVSEISRYTPTEFVFENPELRDIRIGGYFAVGEVDGLLAALEGSFGIDVRRDAQGRIILSGGDAE
jgi:transmembrane sensor